MFSTLFKAATLYSKVVAPFYTPPDVDKSCSFYTSIPNFGVVSFLTLDILKGLQYCLSVDSDFHFLMTTSVK